MKQRKVLTIFCVLAFTIVFAHSLIPHQHHCHEEHAEHIHHFAHCESLGTYLLSDNISIVNSDFPCLLHLHLCAHCYERIAEQRIFDLTDQFNFISPPVLTRQAQRGPPIYYWGAAPKPPRPDRLSVFC